MGGGGFALIACRPDIRVLAFDSSTPILLANCKASSYHIPWYVLTEFLIKAKSFFKLFIKWVPSIISIPFPCNSCVTGKVTSKTCLVITKATKKSKLLARFKWVSASLAREELKFSPRHKPYLKSVEKWYKKLLKSVYTFNMLNPFAPANIYKLGVSRFSVRTMFLNILFERHVTGLRNSYKA